VRRRRDGAVRDRGVLQALATSRAVDVEVLDPRLLLRLATSRCSSRPSPSTGSGFLLHVTALQSLPLFLVQAVIAGSVAVTAVLSVRVFGVRLGRSQWGAVALVVLGLVLLAPTATEGAAITPGAREPLLLLAAVVLVCAAAAAVRRVPGATGTVLLGLLAGTGFGVVAVCARLLPSYGVEVLTAPVAYVLVLAGGTAYLVYSAAMQRGSVTTATAAMVITQTVVPAVAGLFLGDSVRAGLVPVAVVGFALALAGALGSAASSSSSPCRRLRCALAADGLVARCSGRKPARDRAGCRGRARDRRARPCRRRAARRTAGTSGGARPSRRPPGAASRG
jgi:drug/metabolite transporter (DMT)-like permease